MNTYGYTIRNGRELDRLSASTTFLVVADTKEKADKFCQNYVNECIEADKIVNGTSYWWSAYDIQELSITEMNDMCVNIRVV